MFWKNVFKDSNFLPNKTHSQPLFLASLTDHTNMFQTCEDINIFNKQH